MELIWHDPESFCYLFFLLILNAVFLKQVYLLFKKD